MNEAKSLLESKTFWGAAVALAGSALSARHFTLSPADAAAAIDNLTTIVGAVGSLLAIIGRVVATKQIGSALPK